MKVLEVKAAEQKLNIVVIIYLNIVQILHVNVHYVVWWVLIMKNKGTDPKPLKSMCLRSIQNTLKHVFGINPKHLKNMCLGSIPNIIFVFWWKYNN